METTRKKRNIPSAVNMHLVVLRPALLAVVLVRTLRFVKNADAASMLPHAAAIALDKEPAGVVGLRL